MFVTPSYLGKLVPGEKMFCSLPETNFEHNLPYVSEYQNSYYFVLNTFNFNTERKYNTRRDWKILKCNVKLFFVFARSRTVHEL